ncbi:glutathione S-transferase family protein [Pseudohongiella spirulinae]|uniref:Glutathione S-transferase n=1 Tax=Pseudohongiella spirulinae TaxID=1249552 RepID=A0A0S2K9Z0_9GAMM|nr:glutathione S-transferase family protein [Pseudohongiella spirulinae]ALO45049.1 glutathione S-transferase [Pseudohongiella spirulinae]
MSAIRLVIGNKNFSSWSMRPWLLLKQSDIAFDEVSVPLYQRNTAEKLGPLSPSLKVPALIHQQTTVWDSLAICEYISEAFLDGRGWPASPRKRATARSVCAEIHSEFPNLKKDWPMNCKAVVELARPEVIENEIARIDAIWSCCRRKYGVDGDYMFGRFSIADCMYAPVAISFHNYGAILSTEARKYADTLLANPWVREWISLAQAEQDIQAPMGAVSNM